MPEAPEANDRLRLGAMQRVFGLPGLPLPKPGSSCEQMLDLLRITWTSKRIEALQHDGVDPAQHIAESMRTFLIHILAEHAGLTFPLRQPRQVDGKRTLFVEEIQGDEGHDA